MAQGFGQQKVRPPAVAGSFYPAGPERLRQDVTRFLAEVKECRREGPQALIAPHAGYMYSGPVAAHAFASLRDAGRKAGRVVVIGPAHYVAVRGIAVPTADAFETPLGRVPVDRDALKAIADLPFVSTADAPHAPEHALEVELPFLQAVLDSFVLVPLLVGDAEPEEVADALARIWDETLIVVSSDLSHYLDYDTARRRDAATAAAIERRDWAALGPDDACGFLPVAGLLMLAERHGLKAERLALCNSGDTAGPRDRVVGYGAWVFAADDGRQRTEDR
jgi:AmmeMemoRadiSam system protein B